MTANPTRRTYDSLTRAYDHFNRQLFGGELPPCLITMQRHKGAYGYFCGDRFADTGHPEQLTDEIALNPVHFASRSPQDVLSTLAHEMCHLWQHHFGKPSRGGYHNVEWAARMMTIGLTPTDTGQPGGKMTGQRMDHIIEPGGPFDLACTAFLAGAPAVLYQDRAGEEDTPARKRKAASKTKYSCEACGLNAWAKPDAHLICGDCELPMEPEAAAEEEDPQQAVIRRQNGAAAPGIG